MQNQFASSVHNLPVRVPETVQERFIYQCPEDYLKFPDDEALLFHCRCDHPYLAESVSGLENQKQKDWIDQFRIRQ